MGGGPEDPRRGGLPLAALVGLAALLRWPGLGAESLWIDELWSAHHVLRPFPEMLRSLATGDNHPPLFHLAQWIVTRLGDSEFFLRLPSAVFGVLAVPVAFRVGRRFASREAGLLAAALVTLSPFAVHHSREARYYALVLLLSLFAVDAFLSVHRRGRARDVLALGAAAAALVLTHYLTAVWLAALGVGAALCSRRTFLRTAAAGGVAIVLAGPWIPVAARHVGAVFGAYWLPPPTVPGALRTVADVVVAGPIEGAMPGALLALLSLPWLAAIGREAGERSPETRALLVLFALPLAATFALGFVRPLFMARALAFAVAPAVLLAADAATRSRFPRVAAAALVLSLLAGLPFAALGRYREDWRGAVATLARDAAPGETVLLHPFLRPGLEYYGPRTPDLPPLAIADAPAPDAVGNLHPEEGTFWLIVRPIDVRTTGLEAAFHARFRTLETFERNNLKAIRFAGR